MAQLRGLDAVADQYPSYDFGRPAQLGRDHMRQLEAAFETFARLWSSELTAKIRVRTLQTLQSVDLLSYEQYANELPNTTAMVAATFPGHEEACVVQFGLDSALLWVVQMMGGKSPTLPEARTFTPIEYALIRNLMDGVFGHLGASLGALIPGEPVFNTIHFNPQFTQVASAGTAVLVARYNMRLGDTDSTATVMIPASVVVDKLAEADSGTMPPHNDAVTLRQVRSTPIDLTLRIAPITIGAGEVLNLAAGDLLRFSHAETKPFELVAGDTPIARANLGARGSRLACTITSIPEETS